MQDAWFLCRPPFVMCKENKEFAKKNKEKTYDSNFYELSYCSILQFVRIACMKNIENFPLYLVSHENHSCLVCFSNRSSKHLSLQNSCIFIALVYICISILFICVFSIPTFFAPEGAQIGGFLKNYKGFSVDTYLHTGFLFWGEYLGGGKRDQ